MTQLVRRKRLVHNALAMLVRHKRNAVFADLGSSIERCAGSIPVSPTRYSQRTYAD
ncbi:MAG: hypothetical protein Aurels2KO_56930 [Aureliella sp.]